MRISMTSISDRQLRRRPRVDPPACTRVLCRAECRLPDLLLPDNLDHLQIQLCRLALRLRLLRRARRRLNEPWQISRNLRDTPVVRVMEHRSRPFSSLESQEIWDSVYLSCCRISTSSVWTSARPKRPPGSRTLKKSILRKSAPAINSWT